MALDHKKLQSILADLSPAMLQHVDKLVADAFPRGWVPIPGRQTQAYYSKADLLLYGGAAGGGKTDLLIGLGLQEHERSLIFRRSYRNLEGIEQRLIKILGNRQGYNGQSMSWQGEGRLIEMGALEKPGAEFDWQGRPHDFIGFDEGAQLSQDRVRFVMGWLRTTKPGQRCRIVIASNPPMGGEGEWLIEWFAPWLDPMFPDRAKPGELRYAIITPSDRTIWLPDASPVVIDEDEEAASYRPATQEEIDALTRAEIAQAAGDMMDDETKAIVLRVMRPRSRSFIPASVTDNPYIGLDYVQRLNDMPEPMRSKMLKGDFMAGREDHEWQVIPTAWVESAQARWRPPTSRDKMTVMGVDVAQGGKDKTVIAPMYNTGLFDKLIVKDGVDTKDGPAVAALVVRYRRGRALPVVDCGGGWGGDASTQLTQQGINVIRFIPGAASSGRTNPSGSQGFANLRSEMWWRMREALDPNSLEPIALPPGDRLKAELTTPRWAPKGDKIAVETKEDLKKRLGRSTDEADAVCQARLYHQEGARNLISSGATQSSVPDADPFQDRPDVWHEAASSYDVGDPFSAL